MTCRSVGAGIFNLIYDAENRLSKVQELTQGPCPAANTEATQYVSATFTFWYDGDGKRVKQNFSSAITYFVGNIYEKKGTAETKYYYAGGTRIAVRWGANLYYLLTDHLGSTTVTTDVNGYALDEVKYTPWGEVRSGGAPTNYTFTGQYSNTSDFGLMYYHARWMDPDLGRFASADSVVPAGLQGYDRYAYANNNPVNFTDPSGHWADEGCGSAGKCEFPESPPPSNYWRYEFDMTAGFRVGGSPAVNQPDYFSDDAFEMTSCGKNLGCVAAGLASAAVRIPVAQSGQPGADNFWVDYHVVMDEGAGTTISDLAIHNYAKDTIYLTSVRIGPENGDTYLFVVSPAAELSKGFGNETIVSGPPVPFSKDASVDVSLNIAYVLRLGGELKPVRMTLRTSVPSASGLHAFVTTGEMPTIFPGLP